MIATAWVLVAIPAALAVYAYIGYPITLWIFSKKKVTKKVWRSRDSPYVSIVIPAYNEEKEIAGAIDAVLTQDYPRDRLQVLVLSDASNDSTDEIVRRYESRGVELLRIAERRGKTNAENLASSRIRGEIVVNSDSSIRLHSSAVRELVSRMADPDVGVASGRDVSISPDATLNVTEAGYVDYEMRVRVLETMTGGIVGASGSCYAIRTELHRIPVREDLSRDFSAALVAREHGFRAVSVDEAICFVPRTSSLRREYRRKVRTISRGMETLYAHRSLLDPTRSGLFAWKLLSHKICRWLLPLSVIPGIVGLVILATSRWWPRTLLAIGGIVAVLAILGALWPSEKRAPGVISLAAFGVAANVAVLHAIWRVLTGRRDHIWEPTRRTP